MKSLISVDEVAFYDISAPVNSASRRDAPAVQAVHTFQQLPPTVHWQWVLFKR